jgi:hypothetical protein
MRAINATILRRQIYPAVEQGVLTSGPMHSKSGTALTPAAGSIRTTVPSRHGNEFDRRAGPAASAGVDLVLALSSMLKASASVTCSRPASSHGHINPAVVTKLSDRVVADGRPGHHVGLSHHLAQTLSQPRDKREGVKP